MKKYVLWCCVVGLTAIMATGCGKKSAGSAVSNSSMFHTEGSFDMAETKASSDNGINTMPQEAIYEEGKGSAESEISQTGMDRKLIKTVSMNVETEEFDSLIVNLQARISGLGGYVENSNTNNSGYYVNNGRYANYVIRVPADKLEELIGNVAEIANVTWKEEGIEDITLRYIDVESHKIALQTEQDRLLVLMEKAESVEDLIAIESRMSEVRYQIQSYESTLRMYDNQIDYSTLHLSISEVKKLTPQEELSVWEKIQDGFMENLDHVITGTRDFFIGVVVAIPYLVVWGVTLCIGCGIGKWLLIKWKRGNVGKFFKISRKQKKGKDKEEEKGELK